MKQWEIKRTKKYNKQHRDYENNTPDELIAVLENFETYRTVVSTTGNPRHPFVLNKGPIHSERKGIIGITQTGVITNKTLQETRLYVYPDIDNKILYVLTIGNKNTQAKDIKWCCEMVEKTRKK